MFNIIFYECTYRTNTGTYYNVVAVSVDHMFVGKNKTIDEMPYQENAEILTMKTIKRKVNSDGHSELQDVLNHIGWLAYHHPDWYFLDGKPRFVMVDTIDDGFVNLV